MKLETKRPGKTDGVGIQLLSFLLSENAGNGTHLMCLGDGNKRPQMGMRMGESLARNY